MDQKIKFGGIIGSGESYTTFLFRHFSVIRLPVILNDAAGAVGAHSGGRFDDCYMVVGGPNSCFLDHLIGLLFCL